MAKDIYDKLKVISEIFKNYKWFILIFVTGVSGTNVGHYFFNQSKLDKHLDTMPVNNIINKTIVRKVDYNKIQVMIDKSIKIYAVKRKKEHTKGEH